MKLCLRSAQWIGHTLSWISWGNKNIFFLWNLTIRFQAVSYCWEQPRLAMGFETDAPRGGPMTHGDQAARVLLSAGLVICSTCPVFCRTLDKSPALAGLLCPLLEMRVGDWILPEISFSHQSLWDNESYKLRDEQLLEGQDSILPMSIPNNERGPDSCRKKGPQETKKNTHIYHASSMSMAQTWAPHLF